MSRVPKPNASTQEHLDIDDIIDDVVILKTGWVALVMATTAVNFDLLSEAEQDGTIYAYGAFLNSLTFPLQVLIRSKKADITAYFQSLEEAEASQPNPDLKRQIQKYQDFIQATVQQKTVLDKRFYLIINYSPLEGGFKGVSKNSSTPKGKAALLDGAKAALAPKRDHVIKQTARLGLLTRQMTTQELIELFYDIYNPAPTGTQRVLLDTDSYTTPIVEPAIENPTPVNVNTSGIAVNPAVASAVVPAGNLGNLRPVPTQPMQQPLAPMPAAAQQVQAAPVVTPVEMAAQPTPQPIGQTIGLSGAQAEALRNLQAAAAKASGVISQQQVSSAVQAAPAPTQEGVK